MRSAMPWLCPAYKEWLISFEADSPRGLKCIGNRNFVTVWLFYGLVFLTEKFINSYKIPLTKRDGIQ